MTLDDREPGTEMGAEMGAGSDATPDAVLRRVPRGHGVYVRVIALAPAQCEPWIRRTATGARKVRVTARHGIRLTVRAVRRSRRSVRRRLGRTRRRFGFVMRRFRRFMMRRVRLFRRFMMRRVRRVRRVGWFMMRRVRRVQPVVMRRVRRVRPVVMRRVQPVVMHRVQPVVMHRVRPIVMRRVRPVVMRGQHDLRRLTKRRMSGAPLIADDGRPVDADLASFTPRSSLSKRWFPPTVTLPGSGEVVLVDAVGSTCADIVRAAAQFTPRTIVVTNDPAVGVLRDAGIVYEYVPRATPDGRHGDTSLAERIGWLDDVYGLDRVVTLDEFASCDDGRMVR